MVSQFRRWPAHADPVPIVYPRAAAVWCMVLLRSDVPPKVVSEALGHEQIEAAKVLGDRFGGRKSC